MGIQINGQTGRISHSDGNVKIPSSEIGISELSVANNAFVAGIMTVTSDLNVSGNIAIGGTLTYEDVTNVDSVGLITARSGVHFGATGAGTLVVGDSDGIGIGTDNPTAPLTVMSSSDPEIKLGYNESQSHTITWDSSKLFINADPGNANGSSALGFRVDGTEKLRITSTGNVGIKTDDPSWGVSSGLILGGGAAPAGITLFSGTTNVGDLAFADAISGIARYRGLIRYDHSDDSFAFRTNSSERVRITSAGNVGIGTEIPGARLEVNSATSSQVIIKTPGANNSARATRLSFAFDDGEGAAIQSTRVNGGSTLNCNLSFRTGGVTNSEERLGIGTDGTVNVPDGGKFTAGNSHDLQIYHDSGNNYVAATSGSLFIRGSDLVLEDAGGNDYITCSDGGAGGTVTLKHLGSTKLETTTTGAKVTGALEVTQEYPSIRPTLDLNFAATKTLDRRITFTRDSLGTYIDENGVLKYAPNNTPRFDHDLATGESLGLLIEEAGTNYSLYSRRFDIIASGSWVPQNGGATPTVTANTHTAPDGTSSGIQMADTITGATGTAFNGNVVQQQYTAASNVTHTFSLYIKLLTATQASIYIRDGATGSVSSSNAQNTQDWQRVVVTSSAALTNGTIHSFYIGNANGTIAVWGSQIEDKGFASSYITTDGSTGSRAADYAKITGTNFTDFYNYTESAVSVRFNMYGYTGSGFNRVYEISDGTTNNRHSFLSLGTSAAMYETFVISGSGEIGTVGDTITFGNFYNYTESFKNNDYQRYLNVDGTFEEHTDTSIPIDNFSPTQIIFGGHLNSSSAGILNGHISYFKYYNKRLPNAQLQGLTQQ